MNIQDFLKKMNTCFERIIWIFIKYIIFWISIWVFVCLRQQRSSPNFWNSSEINQGSLVEPISVHFRGVLYLYRGLRRTPKPYFGLIMEFWIIFLIFLEWIILLNILDSIEWIFFWMNISDFVLNWILNWIIFWPNSILSKAWTLNIV